jgi:hypothetical protein
MLNGILIIIYNACLCVRTDIKTGCVLNINILFLQIQLHESTGVHTLAEVR